MPNEHHYVYNPLSALSQSHSIRTAAKQQQKNCLFTRRVYGKCNSLHHALSALSDSANKLQEKGIHYTEFTDVQKMLEMGMDMMPVLQVGEQQYGFKEAIKIVGGM